MSRFDYRQVSLRTPMAQLDSTTWLAPTATNPNNNNNNAAAGPGAAPNSRGAGDPHVGNSSILCVMFYNESYSLSHLTLTLMQGYFWEQHVYILDSTRQVVRDGGWENRIVWRGVGSFGYTRDFGPRAPHFSYEMVLSVQRAFPMKVVSYFGDIPWSPDLTILDFFLWVFLK
ncbi:hypothetical protein C0J52_01414 [Blattella germanica]|nr:hypothetical protein C0J52_01414 [Blattella germanica]